MEQQTKNNDFVSPELLEKAEEIINRNAKYCNLKKEYDKAVQQRNYVKQMQLKDTMGKVMRGVMEKLVEQEIEERKTTGELLKMLSQEDGHKYCEMLNALCLCFDVIDYIVTDVNDLMKKNGVVFNFESLPEIKKCKEKVASVVNSEVRKMDERQQQEYIKEADNAYAYLLKRGGVFRRKVDKLTAKDKKRPSEHE